MLPADVQLSFAAATLVMAVTPGPNMVYLASRSASQGRRAGLISLVGIVGGFLLHAFATAAGLAALLLAVPIAYEVVRWGGVGYLLYLGWTSARNASMCSRATVPALPAEPDQRLLLMGFATTALNPKVAVFYLAVIPQFISPQYGPIVLQSLNLVVIQMLASFCVNVFVILFASKAGQYLSARQDRMLRCLLPMAFLGMACRVAVDPRRI